MKQTMDKRYSESHEWVQIDGDIGVVGVTNYAQKELGDIVYVELPTPGKSIESGEEVAVLESTKAAADVYSPVSGEILEVNETLNDQPELVNQGSETSGWLYKIRLTKVEELDKLYDRQSYEGTLEPRDE